MRIWIVLVFVTALALGGCQQQTATDTETDMPMDTEGMPMESEDMPMESEDMSMEDVGEMEHMEHGGAMEAGGDEEIVAIADLAIEVDPVCGMALPAEGTMITSEYEGKIYGFCAVQCQEKFEEDPARVLEIYANRQAMEEAGN